MFKTISAALLAVSVLAAPAFAATGKTTQTAVIKTQAKSSPVKAHANARIGKHHGKYHHTRYVRHHTHHKIAAHRTHGKVSYRPASHTATKRG